jgi:hypothetical protein
VSKSAVSKRRIIALASCLAAIVAVALLVLSPAHRSVHANSAAKPVVQSPVAQSNPATPPARAHLQASFAALPLAFEQNQGQTDAQVKYMARGSGYGLFLTNSDAVFAFHAKNPASDLPQRGRHSAAANAARRQQPQSDAIVRMQLLNGDSHAQIAAVDPLPGKTNYYIGNNPKNWHSNVPQFARVNYKNVYPGIDLAYYGQQSKLEFDFILAPGSSPAPIHLAFTGAQHVSTDGAGNLVVSSRLGNVTLHKPVAYQQQNGERQLVDASFSLKANNEVSFNLGKYDPNRELVIDPSLTYATYLGGGQEDEVFAIAKDGSNNIYVTGESDSTSGWPSSAGGNVISGHNFDVFVTKLTSTGAMSYTTFVGGTGNDSGLAIATDSAGNAYVTGITTSTLDFPTTSGVVQQTSTSTGNCTNQNKTTTAPCTDAFALKLGSTGTKSWATFVSGNNDDEGYGIAIDSVGNVWVVGDTFSAIFYPLTVAGTVLNTTFNHSGTLNPPANDGFVVELSPTAASYLYATYLGGSFSDQINAIAIDSTDNVYVAGETNSADFPTAGTPYQSTCGSDQKCNATASTSYYDAFVAKLATGGASLVYSTYIGGSSDDYAFGLAVDGSGDAFITGFTSADDTTTTPAVPYPTTSGAFSPTYSAGASSNGFVTELNPAGSKLVYSTFLGGSNTDAGGGITLDSVGDAYVTGMTQSADFPVTSNAIQSKLNGNGSTTNSDAFVTQVLAGGAQLGFSTYLGGSLDENATLSGSVGTIVLDSSNNIWVGGSTSSGGLTSPATNFPVTSTSAQPTYGGNPYDGFVAEISSAAVLDFNISATTPAAVAPGASATTVVTLTSLFGYASPVNLTCAVTGSGTPLPACGAFSPVSPITPTAAGATTTLTITTTGAAAANAHSSKFFYAMLLPIAGMSLLGMTFSTARTRRKKLLGFLMVGMVMTALFLMPACGGGSSSSGGGGGGGGGGCSTCTPAGSYTVTITGTGTDASATTHTATATLTVN